MASREPVPINALQNYLPEPMPPDALRVNALAQVGQLPPPARRDEIRATPKVGLLDDLQRAAGRWARQNNVPSTQEFPPLRILSELIGGDPIANVGPGAAGKAIAAFATRAPGAMRKFADPGFHNWMIKHGPPKGFFSQLRDYAPETVIEDLWRQYSATPSARFGAARGAARRGTAEGAELGRRSGDPVKLRLQK